MKKLFLLILFSHIFHLSNAQDWVRYYGVGQQPNSTYCIEHYDKGYILSGSVNDFKYGWLIKTDVNGGELWNIKIGDGINTQNGISNVENTTDHGIILCGSATFFNPPHTDPYIMKINSCGELEWCKAIIYDNEGDGSIMVKQTSDGGYVLLAIFYGNDPDDRIHLFKFDSEGELFWHKIYNRDSLTFGEDMRALNVDDENFLITGFCYYPNWIKPYFIQTDTSGNETWRLVFSQNTGLEYVGDASISVKDIRGNYYAAGRREGSPELFKFSKKGTELMNVDLFPTAIGGDANTLQFLNDTIIITTAGWTFNGSTGYMGIIKTDTLGNIKKIKYLPDPDYSGIRWITKTHDNKILLTGTNFISSNSRIVAFKVNSDLEYDTLYTHPFNYDSLCPHPIASDTIDPDCGLIVNVDEPFSNPDAHQLKVFPNPAKEKLTILMPRYLIIENHTGPVQSTTVYHQWKSTHLEVYNLSGKKIMEREVKQSEKEIILDVSGWQRGMYVFRLIYNKQEVGNTKVVVE